MVLDNAWAVAIWCIEIRDGQYRYEGSIIGIDTNTILLKLLNYEIYETIKSKMGNDNNLTWFKMNFNMQYTLIVIY